MFSLFLSAFFVRQEVYGEVRLEVCNLDEARQRSLNGSDLYVIVTSRSSSQELRSYPYLEDVYQERVAFCFGDDDDFRKELKQSRPKRPYVVTFTNGHMGHAVGPFKTDESFLSYIDSRILPLEPTAETQQELFTCISGPTLSLVVPPKLRQSITTIARSLATRLGFIKVCSASDSLLKSMGSPPGKILIYRSEDSSIEIINPDQADIIQNAPPTFKKYTLSELKQLDDPALLFVESSYDPQLHQFLAEIGTLKSFFKVGYISQQEALPLMSITNSTQVIAINLRHQYYYPIHLFEDEPFDGKKWASEIVDWIKQVYNSKIRPIYISEDGPLELNRGLYRITGNTYPEFHNDTTMPRVVFYHKKDNRQHRSFFRIFSNIASSMSDFATFGFIDIEHNGYQKLLRTKYPSPDVAVFPIGAKINEGIHLYSPTSKAVLKTLIRLCLDQPLDIIDEDDREEMDIYIKRLEVFEASAPKSQLPTLKKLKAKLEPLLPKRSEEL